MIWKPDKANISGSRIHTQTENNALYKAMKYQVAWIVNENSPSALVRYYHPFRPLMMWWHNRVMRNCILPHIQRGIADYESLKGPKTINSLAIKSYLEGDASADLKPSAATIDPEFLDVVVAHLKIFLFAGHDTTASTLCFAYYLLYRNPSTLAALRAELENVFGPDLKPSATAAIITANPSILNQLPYASAVIKETLRLYPPIGTIRAGAPDFFLTNPETKQRYPTEGWMLFGCSLRIPPREVVRTRGRAAARAEKRLPPVRTRPAELHRPGAGADRAADDSRTDSEAS
jgi:hypothetical protein